MWAEEIQKHIPFPYESSLVMLVDWSCLKNRKEGIDISQGKVVRASCMVHSRPNIQSGLHVHNMRKSDVYALG